jgi:hypothetical protein
MLMMCSNSHQRWHEWAQKGAAARDEYYKSLLADFEKIADRLEKQAVIAKSFHESQYLN